MLRAILVSVDYTDLLRVTLPYNRHHFSEVMIITSYEDAVNVRPVAEANNARLFVTDAFYRAGASFNKWLALEEGLDVYGRHGFLCLMDADVLWPKVAPITPEVGKIYTPLRHILADPAKPFIVPEESEWCRYRTHRNEAEWAGYTQIFHATDPVLGAPPWHDTLWTHCGGADSFFQMKWDRSNKIRPPWKVLHIGNPGENWFGRSTPYLTGGQHKQAVERKKDYLSIWQVRRDRRLAGLDPYEPEKLK